MAIVHYNNCSQQPHLCTCVLKIFTLWPGHSEVGCAADYTPPPPPHPIARFKHHGCRVNLALSHAPLFGPFSPVRGAVTYLMLISNPNPVLLGNDRGRQWLSVLTFRWRIGAGVTMATGTRPSERCGIHGHVEKEMRQQLQLTLFTFPLNMQYTQLIVLFWTILMPKYWI